MSKRNYYIFHSGRFKRKQNTIWFDPDEKGLPEEIEENPAADIMAAEAGVEYTSAAGVAEPIDTEPPEQLVSKPLPVEDIYAIYCFSELQFNTRFLQFISKKEIILHFFNYYGFYTGSYIPKETLVSGALLVRQVQHYTKKQKRVDLARKFIEGAGANMLRNLQYYQNREREVGAQISKIEELLEDLQAAKEIDSLMGIEGNIRTAYYSTWQEILTPDVEFEKRQKHPPDNPVNTLISFANSMIYTLVLGEIYRTQLNPLISYLHEPGERRFSLSLDIAEVFKPLIADRLIFSLLNKGKIKPKHFTDGLNMCHMNEQGRKAFLREYDEKLKTTIKHRGLGRSVSYRRLVRLECYKLIKHLIGEQEYEPFKIWW